MKELFLIAALALPASQHTRPPIVPWQASSEEDKLRAWIRKRNPGAEVFIHPEPQEDKLKEDGWERVPFRWRDKSIWIKRKPASDQRKQKMIGVCA